ncbi:MAG: amidohydrolase family protein, partial [Planctomycetaceae bacterium]|nr:amidohydrolase family protein [Planctomycetaceae bacterium]
MHVCPAASLLLTACALLTSTARAAEPAGPAKYDVVLRGGTVIDGTGQPGHRADVGIRDGRIAAVGDLSGRAAETVIDAGKQIVCPGFIDLHSHADRGLIEHPAAENYVRQGVTTLLCGNCGSSPTDLKTFFAALKKTGTGPNVVMLVGHGSVRQQVMGRLNAAPSPEQLDEMKTLVREAMQHGAVGLSTSLRYGPGTYAT